MIKIEKSSCIVLQYNWKLEKVKRDVVYLSKKIKYQKNDSFRMGFKIQSPYTSPTLLFLTTNLNKLGLKAAIVTFSSDGSDAKRFEMDLKSSSGEANGNGALQLFTASIEENYNLYSTTSFNFNFTVYLTGIIEDFRIQQMDGLWGKQLWSTLSNQVGTNFKLMTKDGNSLMVHKWVLAARSPSYCRLFSHQTRLESLSLDCTADEMNQFIKFIYTGDFEGPVGDKIFQLAVKYEVKTLEKLIQAASQVISVDKMASIIMHLKPGTNQLCSVESGVDNSK